MNPTPAVAPGFVWHDTPLGPVLRCEALQPLVEHAFTTRTLRFREASEEGDYGRLAGLLGLAPDRLGRVRQVHGRRVAEIAAGGLPAGGAPAGDVDADAIVCWTSDGGVSVRTADCVPILLADRDRRVVAAVHAGWRGTCVGVAGQAVAAIEAAGVPAATLVAALGPAIGPCCYQVDDRVRTSFLGMTPDAAAWFAEDGPGRWKLDLLAANVDQLEDAGVPGEAIHVAGLCTAEQLDVCFSHRRVGPPAGRMAAAARLRS